MRIFRLIKFTFQIWREFNPIPIEGIAQVTKGFVFNASVRASDYHKSSFPTMRNLGSYLLKSFKEGANLSNVYPFNIIISKD